VEYELTAYGRTLVPVLTLMAKWGKKHKKLMEAKKNPAVGSRLLASERNAAHP
jgi:DNA-binding HxlR family transcriptional regulator